MKCHTQKADKATPTNQSHSRRNTISEEVPIQPAQDDFNINSPSVIANVSTGIPLMQILSTSNDPQQTSHDSPKTTRHASIDIPHSFINPTTTQNSTLDMQLSGTSWTVSSPMATMNNKTTTSSHAQKPSPSQNGGELSNFDTSMTSPQNSGQTPRPEMAPNLSVQFADHPIEWLPQSTDSSNCHDPFQMWLFPSLGDLDQSPDFLQTYGLPDAQPYTEPKDMTNGRPYDPVDRTKNIAKVPRERFSRVQRCWNPRPGRVYRTMPILWREVASSPMDNLFSESPVADDFRTTTNWGLDSECRVRLRDTFRTPAPSRYHSPKLPPVDQSLSQPVEGEFPPAEILDIALGLFFRRFHPTVPFIHVATFSVRNTSSPMLFAICLIGLSILGTTGATRFVSRMFPSFLQRVSSDLAAAAGSLASPTQQMVLFATGLLTLNLSVITGDKDCFNQSQMLYVSLLAMVQQNGLFAAGDGQSLDALLSEMSESDDRWKAWSRIESAKRLILGLLQCDSWYSNLLSKSPIVRSESVCLVAACDEQLFQAKSATQWQSLLRSGKSQNAPTFKIEDLHKLDMQPIANLGYLGRSTLLALLQIQILEAYQRLMPPDQLTIGSYIPWHMYSSDARARTLVPALLAASTTAGPIAKVDDTNCNVLWHSLCTMLLADFRMFELAAGRHGAGPAMGALENISHWSSTQAARRACVHAAQTFKLMSHRRVSDNVTIHSVTALFASALVLGLYLFMVNPSSGRQGTAPVELLDCEPNWSELGELGFKDDSLLDPVPGDRNLTTNRDDESFSQVYQFVKYGGVVSLSGTVHAGGYEGARRVLLDFANQMDGISGRRLRFFTQVLHIMSDDLMNVDTGV